MGRHLVLIVDDEPNILTALKRALEVEGYRAVVAQSGPEALGTLAEASPDLVLLDVVMPKLDGIEVLRRIKEARPDLPVVMMSGNATIDTAVQATKLGAFDFIEKPLSTDKILITLDNALRLARLSRENAELRRLTGGAFEMIGEGPVMKQIFSTIAKTAPTQARVLITGPNGTGKELVARALHANSKRSAEPFVKVNCAAIPHDLIESELFGHEKGAFTGASAQRKGKFEQAHGGTLFLDEVGDMSLSAQAKVLRALQEGEIERVGGGGPIQVDVRVIAATNKDLPQAIAAGEFREDLYYRLNVVPVAVPPLREHREDIPAMARHFLDSACRQNDLKPKTLTEGAVGLLMQNGWPGNVRELKNSIERLAILANGDTIGEQDVSQHLGGVQPVSSTYQRGASLKDMLATAERELILHALKDACGQVSRAAAELQVERSHLYKKMRSLGIDPKG